MNPLYSAPEPSIPKDHEFNDLYFGLDNGTIAKISHQPSDLIMRCTVAGESTKPCEVLASSGGHVRFLGPTYGLCYTYNVNLTGSDRDMDFSKRSGQFSGLELMLNLEGI